MSPQNNTNSQNSLDALCKRFNIDNSKRTKHTALIDCELLKQIYINLLGQKEPKLNLKSAELVHPKFKDDNTSRKASRIIVKPSNEELKIHNNYLKTKLQKNFFN